MWIEKTGNSCFIHDLYRYDGDNQLVHSTTDTKQLGSNGLHVSGSFPPPTKVFAMTGSQQELVWEFGLSFNCSIAPDTIASGSLCAGNCTVPHATSKARRHRCAVDGDVARTVVSIRTAANDNHSEAPAPSIHNVTVTARVEAIPSCLSKVKATINGSAGKRIINHKSKGGVMVELHIIDVDGHPINFTSPEFSIHWKHLEPPLSNKTVPSSR